MGSSAAKGRLRVMKLKNIRFGRDDLLLHVSSALLALFVFYSVIFAANLLKIPFYLGYKKYIINITVLSVEADRILWVGSITLFLAITVLRRLKNGFTGFSVILDREMLILSLFYGMLILLAIEAASFACWVYNLFYPSLPFSGESWHFAFTEVQLTNILYPALPVLLMFFAYSWIGEFTFKGLLTRGEETGKENANHDSIPYFKSSKISIIIIVSSVVAALFIGYYNFAIAGVDNPGFPGVDVPLHYTKYLREVSGMSFLDALGHAAENDRFLYLVFQYFCFLLLDKFMDIDAFVTYFMPFVLTLLFMLSTFMLVRVGRSTFHAATAMLTTVFSFQVTVGLYAAFFANWFALCFVYVFYDLLILALKRRYRNPFLMVLAGLSSIAVLYTHPWTWILLVIMILSAYITTTLLLVYFRKSKIQDYVWELKFLAALLAVNLIMLYVKGLIGVGSGSTLVDGYIDTKRLEPSIFNVFSLKIYLDRTFNWYVGGFYAYVPMMILGVLGVLSLLDYDDRYNRLLLNWMLVASAMAFVDFPWQARFLYMTPFNIYTTLGTIYGAEQIYKNFKVKSRKPMATLIFWTFFALSIFLLLNYTVRCITIKQYGPTGLTMNP